MSRPEETLQVPFSAWGLMYVASDSDVYLPLVRPIFSTMTASRENIPHLPAYRMFNRT